MSLGEGLAHRTRDVRIRRGFYSRVNFLAVHSYLFGRVDSDAHLVPFDPQNRNRHVVTIMTVSPIRRVRISIAMHSPDAI